MTRKLDGKVAIITGAGSGIGRAITIAFGRAGATVVIADIDLEGAEKVASELQLMGAATLLVKTDISKEEDVNGMVGKTIAEFRRVDILVNNAAAHHLGEKGQRFRRKTFCNTTPADWEQEINVTLKGTLYCVRAVVPHMITQKSGRIISITSSASKMPSPTSTLYSACKAAIAGFSRSLAAELACYNILVNCVAPGPTRTPIFDSLEMSIGVEELLARIPLGRMGKPEEIANMVLFLASDEAKYITGQHYSVDGGFCMY